MATFEEWREHFSKMSALQQNKLKEAINKLESDKLIKKEYEWTGLFKLKTFMQR